MFVGVPVLVGVNVNVGHFGGRWLLGIQPTVGLTFDLPLDATTFDAVGRIDRLARVTPIERNNISTNRPIFIRVTS